MKVRKIFLAITVIVVFMLTVFMISGCKDLEEAAVGEVEGIGTLLPTESDLGGIIAGALSGIFAGTAIDLWGTIAGALSGIFAALYLMIRISYFLGMFIFGIVLILILHPLFGRFNDKMKSSLGRCVAGGAITLFGVPFGMTIILAIGVFLLLSILGAAFSFILFAAGGILLIIYGVLIFVSTIFLSYFIGGLILSKSKLDSTKYGVRVLAFFIGLVIIEFIYTIPGIGTVAQLAGILFGLGGLSIIIYDWIKYKDNPFKANSPSQVGKPKTRKSGSKRSKK